MTLSARPNGKPLQCPRVNRIRAFMRPEPPAAADSSSDAHARSVRQANHGGVTVQHLHARAFEHPPERYPAQRSQVVVAKHRDHGQSSGRQELASHLGFEQATVLSEVAGDKQEIGVVGEGGKAGHRTQVFRTTNVEIPSRRHANPEELWGANLLNGRWQPTFHGTEAYLIARGL
jgi:hypothetical protein